MRDKVEQWLKRRTKMYSKGDELNLITDCLSDLQPQWVSVDDGKPNQGVRVLLKTTHDDNCPHVVGYWGCGEWEACTVNVEADKDYTGNIACVDRAFRSEDVTHYMIISETLSPKRANR